MSLTSSAVGGGSLGTSTAGLVSRSVVAPSGGSTGVGASGQLLADSGLGAAATSSSPPEQAVSTSRAAARAAKGRTFTGWGSPGRAGARVGVRRGAGTLVAGGCGRGRRPRGRRRRWCGARRPDRSGPVPRRPGAAPPPTRRRVVPFPQVGGQRLAGAAHDDEAVLLGDRPVVGEAVELVVGGRLPHLGDDELHLVRLAGLGEDRAEGLGVGVGEPAAGDVAAVVLVAAQVGVAHAGQPQVLELVVLADRREGDPVVDLADLVQRVAGVLPDEQDPVGVGEREDGAAAGDALAGVVALVLHHLLG